MFYSNSPKILVILDICCKHSKIFQQSSLKVEECLQKCADSIENSADPDQTAPLHCLPRNICPKTSDH